MPKSERAGNAPPGPAWSSVGLVAAAALLAASALFSLGLPARAQDVKAPGIAVVDGLAPGDLLNIRATPTPIGTVQARLPNGAGVRTLGCAQYDGYDWCKVATLDAPKLSGWTPARYLRAADTDADATAPTPPAGATPQAPAPDMPANLDARIGKETGEAGQAADEKLRNAIIARYRPVYRAALGLPAAGKTTAETDAAPAAGAAAPDQPSEDPAPQASGIPVPTPRPDPKAGSAVASVEAAQKSTREVPCAAAFGQPMQECKAAFTRLGPGVADVAITLPDGGARTIRFRAGKPDGSDSSDPLHFTREGSLNMIRIGKAERFEILDALAFGD